MLILNDIHIGVQRKAGVTPSSQEALTEYLFTSFERTVATSKEDTLLIKGDLFDTFEVSPRDWLRTYRVLAGWLQLGKTLYLAAGNHDWSPKGSRMSSFEMMARVLEQQFDTQIVVINIDETFATGFGSVFVAHHSNQDMFDQALARVEVKSGEFLFLHANYDNNFAVDSDHSLNVSEEVARKFCDMGVTLVFAHEHQARTLKPAGTTGIGKVVVLGNQWPTSIIDCKGNDVKFAHTLQIGGELERFETWNKDGEAGFFTVDWNELATAEIPESAMFIRVGGEASRAQAAEVVNIMAKFRASSKCFVITNAVKVDGIAQMDALPQDFEAAKAFDVMAFIEGFMEPDEMKVIHSLAQPEGHAALLTNTHPVVKAFLGEPT
jgi:hypothetical protein